MHYNTAYRLSASTIGFKLFGSKLAFGHVKNVLFSINTLLTSKVLCLLCIYSRYLPSTDTTVSDNFSMETNFILSYVVSGIVYMFIVCGVLKRISPANLGGC